MAKAGSLRALATLLVATAFTGCVSGTASVDTDGDGKANWRDFDDDDDGVRDWRDAQPLDDVVARVLVTSILVSDPVDGLFSGASTGTVFVRLAIEDGASAWSREFNVTVGESLPVDVELAANARDSERDVRVVLSLIEVDGLANDPLDVSDGPERALVWACNLGSLACDGPPLAGTGDGALDGTGASDDDDAAVEYRLAFG